MRKQLWMLLLLLTVFLFNPISATAETSVFTLMDENGSTIALYCGECETGDEYISSDNIHYRVSAVDESASIARLETIGPAQMPDVSWLDIQESLES